MPFLITYQLHLMMGIRWISSVKPFESRTPYQVLQQMNYNLSFTFDDKFLGAVNVLSLVNLFNQSTNQFLSGTIYSAHLVDCDFVHDRNKANCLSVCWITKVCQYCSSLKSSLGYPFILIQAKLMIVVFKSKCNDFSVWFNLILTRQTSFVDNQRRAGSIYYSVRFQYGHCCLIQQITDISFLFLYRKATNMYMSCLVDLSKTAQ
ncbi:hypothetical protein T01_9076 [Trichinella spiralis]|uniref:Uncharacterized protein n=1 Tax=Trichinella spiralis TaxID=6334 RepID=A0A0V1BIB4_TRISP|nr:hypothetical protein T01_9076 [Trichinella spiralis]